LLQRRTIEIAQNEITRIGGIAEERNRHPGQGVHGSSGSTRRLGGARGRDGKSFQPPGQALAMETGDAFYLMQQAAPLLAIGADMRGFSVT